jgi:hypothetical protein
MRDFTHDIDWYWPVDFFGNAIQTPVQLIQGRSVAAYPQSIYSIHIQISMSTINAP